MKIGQSINATQKDIENKRFNYWLGLSLGNKYFTPENVENIFTGWFLM